MKVWKLLLIVFVLIIGLLFINNPFEKRPLEKEKALNINYSERKVNNLTFDRIKIYKKNNSYYFSSRLTNNSTSGVDIKKVDIKLDNYSFSSYVGLVKPGEHKMIFMETKNDLSNNKNVTFKISA